MEPTSSFWSQTWLPVVMQSTPTSKNSRAILSVMPKPPAAFSPLTTTKSALRPARKAGACFNKASRPLRPTTSPRNRSLISPSIFSRYLQGEPLGHDPVQRLVVLVPRHGCHFLRGIPDSNRRHRLLPPQPIQRPIIEPGAVPQAEPGAVEGQQGHQQHVRLDLRNTDRGLQQPIAGGLQR